MSISAVFLALRRVTFFFGFALLLGAVLALVRVFLPLLAPTRSALVNFRSDDLVGLRATNWPHTFELNSRKVL